LHGDWRLPKRLAYHEFIHKQVSKFCLLLDWMMKKRHQNYVSFGWQLGLVVMWPVDGIFVLLGVIAWLYRDTASAHMGVGHLLLLSLLPGTH